jgi:DNA mismatch repair protein MutL
LESAAREADGGSAIGTRLTIRGGRCEETAEVARTHGTTVTVRKLFSNVPARRKFLRSARSETRAAVEALTLLALTRLDVSFTLMSDGRKLLDAPRTTEAAQRVAALFGQKLAGQLLPVEHHDGYLSVRGFAQRPAVARPAGRKAYLFVNGRPFRDPFLVRAAEAGYRATLAPGTRPSLLLALAVPGDRVDVNVHPAKHEVRFRDKFLVERAVEEAVRSTLGSMDAAASVDHPESKWAQSSWRREGGGDQTIPASPPGAAADLFSVAPADRPPVAGERRQILQVFATYLVFEAPDGLTIVDQHSAHERIIYERTMQQLESGEAASQRLLLPLTIELDRIELEAVEQHREWLAAIGFEVEHFGGHSVVVHAVPNPHPRFDAGRCLDEMVTDLARNRFGAVASRMQRFAATYGCRAAIKAGQVLEPVEMRSLLGQLFACALPPHDVHGRPTIVQLPRHELERRFGRV